MMVIKWSKEDLQEAFEGLEDPRVDRTKKYPLKEILFLVLVGALTGVESWRGIEIAGESRLDFLRKYFPYTNGIPSHQTISRVFSLFKPKAFEVFFNVFSNAMIADNTPGLIALDGKAIRGSYDKENGVKALHVLNAFAVENGICLAQVPVSEKSNEITAVPEILECLDLKGATVSVDALNTQKSIAQQIIESGADYTLALKGNHKRLNDQVNFVFDTRYYIKKSDSMENIEKANGRITHRRFEVLSIDEKSIADIVEWKGLKAIGRYTTTTERGGEKKTEIRNYLLSYESAEHFARSARGHWHIENALHWTLDVTFSEDASRKRKDHAPRNFAVVRKLALNIMRKSKDDLSLPLMRYKAASDIDFLGAVLNKVGFQEEIR